MLFRSMLVCGAWVYLGARTTVAMNIALIYSASPVLIALGAVLFLGERFRWLQVAGVAVALTGVVHVIVKGQWTALGSVQWVAGDAWIVAAMVAWAAYALLQKLWPSPLGYCSDSTTGKPKSLAALINQPAIAPLGEAKPNTQIFRELAAAMGFDEPCFRDDDEALARQAFTDAVDAVALERDGWMKQGILVVSRDDQRLDWVQRESVRQIGDMLYGERKGNR